MKTPKFNVGQRVWTRFHHRRTEHVVTHVRIGERSSQSGILYKVEPWFAPKVDAGAPPWEREHWVDEAWFEACE